MVFGKQRQSGAQMEAEAMPSEEQKATMPSEEQKETKERPHYGLFTGALADIRFLYAAQRHLLTMTHTDREAAYAWIKERSDYVATIVNNIIMLWEQGHYMQVSTENLTLWLAQQLAAAELIPHTDSMIAEKALSINTPVAFHPPTDPKFDDGLFLRMALKASEYLLEDRKYRMALQRLPLEEIAAVKQAAADKANRIILASKQLASLYAVECNPENVDSLICAMVRENVVAQYVDEFIDEVEQMFTRSDAPRLPPYLGTIELMATGISEDNSMHPHEYSMAQIPADFLEDAAGPVSSTRLSDEALALLGLEMVPLVRQ